MPWGHNNYSVGNVNLSLVHDILDFHGKQAIEASLNNGNIIPSDVWYSFHLTVERKQLAKKKTFIFMQIAYFCHF